MRRAGALNPHAPMGIPPDIDRHGRGSRGLQEISETDALAEGAMTEYGEGSVISHRRAFNLIWNHLHGPGAWDANPWVAA